MDECNFNKNYKTMIITNKKTIESIINRYQGYCPLEILKVIWDEKLILKGLIDYKKSQIENAKRTKKNNSLEK